MQFLNNRESPAVIWQEACNKNIFKFIAFGKVFASHF
jgi:hypothetical protein